jgi:hypothetical protein
LELKLGDWGFSAARICFGSRVGSGRLLAEMLPSSFFQRLPPSTVALLLASLFYLPADAHVLPRETKTIPHRTLDVELWPLRTPEPTVAALSPAQAVELLKRQENTVCGFIGGDPALPATCGAGSHCVVDKGLGAIGCCPNGQAGCTTGLFTGCVDANSGPQTELNPYVFTCGGSDVCFKNIFAGGFSQFGCGTASDLGTTVATRVSALASALPFVSVAETLTKLPIVTLETPTSIGSRPTRLPPTRRPTPSNPSSSSTSSTSSTSKTTTSTSTTSTTSTTSSSTTSTSSSPSATGSQEAPASSSRDIDQTGAIIGGTISGVAILIAVMAVGLYLWRRRGNQRTGPGPQNTQYIRYSDPSAPAPHADTNTTFSSPMSAGANFAPVASSYDNAEAGIPPQISNAIPGNGTGPVFSYGPGTTTTIGAGPATYGYGSSAAGGMVGAAPQAVVEQDRVPLTREFDDFSRGFNDALENIREEDERASGPPTDTPLWQQNRRQSRNMMWM